MPLSSSYFSVLSSFSFPSLPFSSGGTRSSRSVHCKGKGSPYSITERRVPELIPVLGSQPAGDVTHKPGGRLPLLSARPAVTPQPLRGLLPILLLGEQRHDHRRRLHRGNRELRPGTHARTGANVAFCPGTFHGLSLIHI